jgi:thiopurine S-methyltransferase
MHAAFWAERWRDGRIGFHLNDINEHLQRHIEQLAPRPARVLVPLCGKSRDLGWLAARGHEVWGIEFIEAAARSFFDEHGAVPAEQRLGGHLALHANGITILVADIFDVSAETVGHFSAIYDRAALIAVAPERRPAYLATIHRLAAPEARWLLVTLEHDLGKGPPFSVSPAALTTLVEGRFSLERLEDLDRIDADSGLRERGATISREQVWLGRPVNESAAT